MELTTSRLSRESRHNRRILLLCSIADILLHSPISVADATVLHVTVQGPSRKKSNARQRLHGALTHATEMIVLLLQHHADVNARDRHGVTVLANVMASGAADLADHLRSLGAN